MGGGRFVWLIWENYCLQPSQTRRGRLRVGGSLNRDGVTGAARKSCSRQPLATHIERVVPRALGNSRRATGNKWYGVPWYIAVCMYIHGAFENGVSYRYLEPLLLVNNVKTEYCLVCGRCYIPETRHEYSHTNINSACVC